MNKMSLLIVFLMITSFGIEDVTAQSSSKMIVGIGNKCLDVSGGSTANGAQIILWDCHGGPNQLWNTTRSGELRGIGNKCLDVDASRNADGQKIQLWDCNGGPNQKWSPAFANQIKGWGGRCLDVKNSGTANGTPVIIYPCTGNANQKWRWETPNPARNITFVNRTKLPVLVFNSRGQVTKRISGMRNAIQVSRDGETWKVSVEIGTGTGRNRPIGAYRATNSLSQQVEVVTVAVEAGPIFNQQQANEKCNALARTSRGAWTGGWWTTVQGRMSVCEVAKLK